MATPAKFDSILSNLVGELNELSLEMSEDSRGDAEGFATSVRSFRNFLDIMEVAADTAIEHDQPRGVERSSSSSSSLNAGGSSRPNDASAVQGAGSTPYQHSLASSPLSDRPTSPSMITSEASALAKCKAELLERWTDWNQPNLVLREDVDAFLAFRSEGAFVVRTSSTHENAMVLCIKFSEVVIHYLLER